MENFRNSLKGFSFVLKLVLVIVWDIYGALYRISRGDALGIVLGIVQLVTPLGVVFWVVDIVCMILHKDITVLA